MHISANTAIEEALLGGLIVGSSSAALMFLKGRITGLSGIAKGLVRPEGEDWHITYNIGLLSSGYLIKMWYPQLINVKESIPQSIPVIITAGLLVGYGTRLSGGCTSGHGLCGLSRFSPRSLVSVLTFMSSAAITATIANQSSIAPLLITDSPFVVDGLVKALIPTAAVLGISYVYNSDVRPKDKSFFQTPLIGHLAAFGCALLFGTGLVIGQMVDSDRVLGFLDFTNTTRGWDPSLAGVMGGGVLVTALAFPFMKHADPKTLICQRSLKSILNIGAVEPNLIIDTKLLLGSILFGVGWGLLGVCPGPGWVALGAGASASSLFVPSMLLAMMVRSDYLM